MPLSRFISCTRGGEQPTRHRARWWSTSEAFWFLNRTPSGEWDTLAVPAGGLPFGMESIYWSIAPTPRPEFSYSADAALDDILVLERAGALKGRPEVMIGATGPENSPALMRVFAQFLQNPEPSFRIAALRGMLAGKEEGAIAKLAEMWPELPSHPLHSDITSAIRHGFRDTSPPAVRQLADLAATTRSSELRQAAVFALASIHTKEALPFLATLLTSPDPKEQGKAVFGMSSFANGCPPQTSANVRSMDYMRFTDASGYRTKETEAHFAIGGDGVVAGDPALAKLVEFWSGWWSQHPELHGVISSQSPSESTGTATHSGSAPTAAPPGSYSRSPASAPRE